MTIGCAIAIIGVLAVIGYFAVDLIRSFNSDFLASGPVAKVPDIVGMDEDSAERALVEAGFKPQKRESVISETMQKGLVFRQDPPAGSDKKQGSRIDYYLSLGNPRFVVPDLVGKDIDEAARLLSEAGMMIGRVERVYMPSEKPRSIISHDPVKGKEFPGPISIDLRIADNTDLPQLSMPDLAGQPLRTAEETLARSNLHLHQVDYVSNNSVEAGTVLSQNVKAGESVTLGQQVALTVAAPSDVIGSWTRNISIRVPITGGPRMQHVKIKVFDQIAQNAVVYDEMHESGSFVDKRIPLEGRATVMIYIQDMEQAYREERIPYEKADN